MIREIIKYPHHLLHEKSLAVQGTPGGSNGIYGFGGGRLKNLVVDMFDTMYDAGGVGLAAIQVGVQLRVLVLDINHAGGQEVFVNPEILELKGEPEHVPEGCLSLPGLREVVPRHPHVVVRYWTVDGHERVIDTETSPGSEGKKRLRAQALQHEIEHFEGVLMLDKLSRAERERAIRILKQNRGG